MSYVIADFLIDRVKANGWLSIGNIMFEDAMPCVNPISSGGLVCVSPGKELFFTEVRMDSHMTYCIEHGYLAQDYKNAGLQRTICVEPFARLRHFDVLLLSNCVRWDEGQTKIIVPNYPKIADVEGMKPDEKTGLYPGTDTITWINDKEESAIDIYPDAVAHKEYVGLRVAEYQEFIKNQKAFCKFIGEFMGVTDCI